MSLHSSPSSKPTKRRRLFEADAAVTRKLRSKMVVPGDLVGYKSSGLLKGRGIVIRPSDDSYRATVAGLLTQVDRYISVNPPFQKTQFSIGDVVIGRIAEVQNGRWAVDLGLSRPATLLLANINLPNNEQRRRTAEDSLQIRQYFKERDLIVAEVQRVQQNGGELLLQTRSAKYGLLRKGQLNVVDASLVRKEGSGSMVRVSVTPRHWDLCLTNSGAPPEVLLGSKETPELHLQLVLGANGWVFCAPAPKQAAVETLNFSSALAEEASSKEDLGSAQKNDLLRTTIRDMQTIIGKMSDLGVEVTVNGIEKCYNAVSSEIVEQQKQNNVGCVEEESLRFDSEEVEDIVLEKIVDVCWKNENL